MDYPTFAGRGYAKIPHAKAAKAAKDAKGVIFNFGFLIFSLIPGTHSRARTRGFLTQRTQRTQRPQRSEGEYRGEG